MWAQQKWTRTTWRGVHGTSSCGSSRTLLSGLILFHGCSSCSGEAPGVLLQRASGWCASCGGVSEERHFELWRLCQQNQVHTKFHHRWCALLWVCSAHLRSAVRRTCRTGRSPSVSGLDPKPRPTERHGSCRGACPTVTRPLSTQVWSDSSVRHPTNVGPPRHGFSGATSHKGGRFSKVLQVHAVYRAL